MTWKLVVDIKVHNLERAKTFYQHTLNFTLRKHEPTQGWCSFTIGDAEIHLYEEGGVTRHIEFYVEDIEKEVKKLEKGGINFISGMHKPKAQSLLNETITVFPWGKTAFFTDSEGNELAVVQDHP